MAKSTAARWGGQRARALWDEVTGEYDLGAHEIALLSEICECLENLDALNETIRSEGETVPSQGYSAAPKVHPALQEARQQRIALARLVSALRLPEGDEESRPQARAGVRGFYAMGGAR
ncbi:hypothetical protein [Kitasatospora sp. NPDC001175]|uniref:hypothetical protein n=1 Tax=Kitasatospora sp. NPDC001175 TaxID=3157103 RepID=UPI003D01A102